MNKIESKGHKSVRSRVANISEFLAEPMTMDSFKSNILHTLFEDGSDIEKYKLTEAEWKAVHDLKEEKYANWDWNFGHSPRFNIKRTRRFPVGELDFRLFVEKGLITDFKIYGDFLGKDPIEEFERSFIGKSYESETVSDIVNSSSVENYFGNIDKHELSNLIFGDDL